MKICIDDNYRCYPTNPDGTFREFDVPFFDGKCQTFIEGFRYCPPGESYTNDKGESFPGESWGAWKPYPELEAAQAQYERDMAELQEAYQEGVNSAYD